MFYAISKQKSVFRGWQHIIQLFLNHYLLYCFESEWIYYYYFSHQFQLLCSIYYHFAYLFYKYTVAHEDLLQKIDHFGINMMIFVYMYTYYKRVDILFIFPLHLLIVYLSTYFESYDVVIYTNFSFSLFFIPWILYLFKLNTFILFIISVKFAIIAIFFYIDKSYRFYYKNIYIFGHHELFHLFMAISLYIIYYISL
jgi:hypothetical protein